MTNENVRYLIDERDQRRQARIERQKAARRAEQRTLALQALVGIGTFAAFVAASGVLR